MQGIVTTLTREQVEKRYSNMQDSDMAKLTQRALDAEYSIARIQDDRIGFSNFLRFELPRMLKSSVSTESEIKILGATDASEFLKGVLYVAYKEIP